MTRDLLVSLIVLLGAPAVLGLVLWAATALGGETAAPHTPFDPPRRAPARGRGRRAE